MQELWSLVWDTWLLGGIFAILQYLYSYVHDYGFAIILLTLGFRVILIPVTWKQTKSMYELQEIQPKIKALQEKYKNDKEKQSEELMKFYQENKVNPFGGCLPLLAQMPLFIALFSVLRETLPEYIATQPAELQAGMKEFWIILPDITMTPQQVYQVTSQAVTNTVSSAASVVPTSSVVPGGGGIGGGISSALPYLIFVALFGLSVWLPQFLMTKDKTQRRTGTYMAIMMLYFGFVSPAGVLIYWVTSSAWQVGQQLLTQRMLKAAKESEIEVPAVEPTKSKSKSSKAGKGKKAGSDMLRETTKEAPTVEEAVDAGLEELGVQADAAQYEVVEEPSRGMFGSGKPAKVRVWLKESFIAEAEAEAVAEEPEDDGDSPAELPAELRGESAELPELTDEELDNVADTAVTAIQEILGSFGIEASIDEYEGDEGEIILDIVGGELGILIGRHGKTLDSLQTLVAAITSRKLGFRYPVVVDVEGYRGRRREKLEDMARRTADRVSRQGREVKLRPMTSYERRVIHMALRGDRRVVTGSEGEEPMRSVVVSPK